MKRIFVAIKIDADKALKLFLADLAKTYKSKGVKWVGAEQLHITLQFLGATSEDKVEQICRMMPEVVESFRAFVMEIGGSGVFPSHKRPRIVWLGVSAEDSLIELQRRVKEALEQLGIVDDAKAFIPHITVARIKPNANVYDLMVRVKDNFDTAFQQQMVNSVILYESILTPSGAVYRVIDEFALH